MDFAVSKNENEKKKKSEKNDEYLDLAWELKKVIPTVVSALGTVSKGLEKTGEISIRRKRNERCWNRLE